MWMFKSPVTAFKSEAEPLLASKPEEPASAEEELVDIRKIYRDMEQEICNRVHDLATRAPGQPETFWWMSGFEHPEYDALLQRELDRYTGDYYMTFSHQLRYCDVRKTFISLSKNDGTKVRGTDPEYTLDPFAKALAEWTRKKVAEQLTKMLVDPHVEGFTKPPHPCFAQMLEDELKRYEKGKMRVEPTIGEKVTFRVCKS